LITSPFDGGRAKREVGGARNALGSPRLSMDGTETFCGTPGVTPFAAGGVKAAGGARMGFAVASAEAVADGCAAAVELSIVTGEETAARGEATGFGSKFGSCLGGRLPMTMDPPAW